MGVHFSHGFRIILFQRLLIFAAEGIVILRIVRTGLQTDQGLQFFIRQRDPDLIIPVSFFRVEIVVPVSGNVIIGVTGQAQIQIIGSVFP